MINIHAVLLKLFEPVMDVQFSKIDKVDTDYYLHSERLDISEETKIRATKEEADQYFEGAMKTDTKPNFISDLFYLLNSIFHLGLCKTIDTRSKAEKNIQQMEDELKKLEARRGEWANVSGSRNVTDPKEPSNADTGRGGHHQAEGAY
jgi:ubiquitin conjugation factor E4 B